MTQKLLILGGTAEARELAAAAQAAWGDALHIVTSLAGRVENTGPLAGQVRIGGFGGAEGLAAYLKEQHIDWVIDATHPFAAIISRNAREACEAVGLGRLQLFRPPWRKQPGDRWVEVPDMAAAAKALPWVGRRVFLTTGLTGIEALAPGRNPKHPNIWYLLRLIAPPTTLPELGRGGRDYEIIYGRGPFSVEGERALISRYRINALVSKMSGGEATRAKLTAAREARIPLLMLARPAPEPGPCLETPSDALTWLESRMRQIDDPLASRR